MAVRLVATDLDVTLLRDDGTVSEHILRVMAREVGVNGLAICCNGAMVYDLAADAVVRHAPLPAILAQRLVVALREAAPGVYFAVEQGRDALMNHAVARGTVYADHGSVWF